MRRRSAARGSRWTTWRAALLHVTFIWVTVAPAAAQIPPPSLSVAEYIVWLDEALNAAGDGQSPARLPPAWRIDTPSGALSVSNAWLMRDLRALEAKPDPVLQRRIQDRLRVLRAEAAAFETPAPDTSAARAMLVKILNRPEFRGVHGPTWRERLRQQVMRVILNVLERLFGTSAVPTIGNVVVYLLMAIAVAVAALWTYRWMRRSSAVETVVPERIAVSAKEWAAWIKEAQAAAARGDWRDAVHLSYWCAIAFLEGRGAWRPDRARTPREYLALLPASSEHRPALNALTKKFESTWYGAEHADATTFGDALTHLEKLGCRLV